ncbi:ABC transporter permease [Ruminiclostridium cellobioparum]|uniref:ABC-type proline/glycine betaine transporter, permease n=1 Tax=Ruminiclostridium cellobioparum subsp. termitidis CT1112 TaxID=1195236 RepID=S0FLF1_RUMCE|nr:ABC transporter permease [Ruminiclostridium cellobioparum]EMS69308.1 ABC-type proline/glycine betaine transporter, permease [Ruminiclostridium cellobioparum subsp. termitidis CT1112]
MSFAEYLRQNGSDVLEALKIHVQLSSLSILIAVLIAIPTGIILTRHDRAAKAVLAVAGIIQTIPGLVMLGMGLMLFGLGSKPAVIVLVAYAILPIIQNTYTGIKEIDILYIEAARGIGMSQSQILFKVEIPLGLPAIVAGIRLSVVYIISWATLAALIGAGGLGDLIWTGLSSYDTNMILAGAIPASILSIIAGLVIDLIHRAVTPKPMRIKGDA